MSSHPGPVPELPNVSVDRFDKENTASTCFFLTHCHTDHMHGLCNRFFVDLRDSETYLYCSPISKEILKLSYSDFEDQIMALEEKTVISVPGNVPYNMTVTPIPAGHCPGSVMFLFETTKENILYTGDFRIEKGDTENYTQLESYRKQNGNKILDNIYLDVTFFSLDYYMFPKRSESLEALITFMKEKWKQNPDLHFNLKTPSPYGYESILEGLATAFDCKIHVDSEDFRKISVLPCIGRYLTTNAGETKIHYVEMKKYDFKYKYITIHLSAQKFISKNDKGPEKIQKVGGNKYKICFATHSSFSEIIDFLQNIKFRSCTEATGTCGSPEQIQSHVEKILAHRDADEELSYSM